MRRRRGASPLRAAPYRRVMLMLVAAIGEALIDFTQTGTTAEGYPMLAAHPGGAPANFLAAVRAAGHAAAMLGKVGDDAFGRRLRETLKAAGIDVRGLIADPAVFTTLAFVTLQNGERSFSFARKPGADTCLTTEELDTALLDRADVLHFGTLSLTDEPAAAATKAAVQRAKANGKLLSFDPNYRPLLWKDEAQARAAMQWGLRQADIVKLSDEDASLLFPAARPPEDVCRQILEDYGAKLVFLTLGKAGCCCRNKNAVLRIPAPAGVTVTDTTGAGDIFGGYALAGVLDEGTAPENLSEEALRRIAKRAVAAATLSTAKPGGLGAVPTREETLAFQARS